MHTARARLPASLWGNRRIASGSDVTVRISAFFRATQRPRALSDTPRKNVGVVTIATPDRMALPHFVPIFPRPRVVSPPDACAAHAEFLRHLDFDFLAIVVQVPEEIRPLRAGPAADAARGKVRRVQRHLRC